MTCAPDPRPRLRDATAAEAARGVADIAAEARDQLDRMTRLLADVFGTTPDDDWITDAIWNAEDPRAAVEALIAAQDRADRS